VLTTSPYFPGHTTSIVFRRNKRPPGRYAPSRASLKERIAGLLRDGIAMGLAVDRQAEENIALAREKEAEAMATGDTELLNRAITASLESAKAQAQAGLATAQMMGIALDLVSEAKDLEDGR